MESLLSGGCLCETVRYEIVAEPITLYACHCTDCQTASGASFVLAMRVPTNGIRVTKGNPKPYERSRADGRKKNIFRCPQCLSALWGARVESPQYLTVYAGTLDNSASLQPVVHIWTCDAQPWVAIPDGELVFEQGPPNMRIFEEAWKAKVTEKNKC